MSQGRSYQHKKGNIKFLPLRSRGTLQGQDLSKSGDEASKAPFVYWPGEAPFVDFFLGLKTAQERTEKHSN